MYVHALQSVHLISTLLEGGQFHSYLTAQAENAVARIFALPTNVQKHSLIYYYYLVLANITDCSDSML